MDYEICLGRPMSVTTKKPKPERKSRSSYSSARRHDPRDPKSRRAPRPYPPHYAPPPPYGRSPYPPDYYYGKI